LTLVVLGDFLVVFGVYLGLFLDGGGSTALVIDGKLANKPSDAAGERAVGNAVLVRERTP
jgi:exopolysaccharide biosynthesis protein